MPAERFFTNQELIKEATVFVEGAELHHLAHVMRIELGEEVELVNGKGALAIGKLTVLTKQKGTLHIESVTTSPLPSPSLILAIPLMRLSKLEWVIEKCTELGADGFYLFPASQSEKDSFSPHQLERLSHIAISAMKQCGRLDLPQIKILKKFEEIFSFEATYLFGDTDKKALPMTSPKGLVIFITGPEKGFSNKELDLLNKKGSGVKLHTNILRAETAPMVATALLKI